MTCLPWLVAAFEDNDIITQYKATLWSSRSFLADLDLVCCSYSAYQHFAFVPAPVEEMLGGGG